MCDLGRVGLVVHEEELDVFGVVYQERFVAGRHHVSCLLVGAEPDLYDTLSVDCSLATLLDLSEHAIIHPALLLLARLRRVSNPAAAADVPKA